MATVKMNPKDTPSPSADIVNAAANGVTVTDSTGRRIHLRKPGTLAQYRLIEAAGPAAENRTYMAMTLPLIFVAAIDDIPVPGIATKNQLEALIQRLGDEGIQAVSDGIMEHFNAAPDPDGDRAKLKN